MCWWYNLSLVSFHFVSKWHNMFQSKNSIVLSSVLFKYMVMAGECVCSLGFIRAWMIRAITLGIWITLLIWIVLVVIMSHRSWCYWTSMRNRSFVRLKIKEISFQKWNLTKSQKSMNLPVQCSVVQVSIAEFRHLVEIIIVQHPIRLALDVIETVKSLALP